MRELKHSNICLFIQISTELFTEEAVRLIKQQPKDKPMFLMINHVAPHSANDNSHDPLQAPIETIEKFNATIMDGRRRIYAGTRFYKSCTIFAKINTLLLNFMLLTHSYGR